MKVSSILTNQEIAEKVAKLVFSPKKSVNSLEFAVQLFVESVVIPKELDSYCEEQVRKYIVDYLNNK